MNSKESILDKNPVFADLHLHSRFSRACSKDLSIENLVKWGKVKGLGLLGTGDFTHEKWLAEINEKLEDDGTGILELKEGDKSVKFIFSGEISLIYTQGGKGRRIHFLLLAPNLESVKKINAFLDTKGRRDYDGRPIFGFSAVELVKEMGNISEDIEIIPAHAYTPYFGIFGSETGFNSLKEAFGEHAEKIHAIETGMSSDPEMNWRIKELGNKTIVSFSDSHSFWPWRIGREATVFQEIRSYRDLIKQIRENSILGTIETDPAYGKYHWDGHANCKFSSSPEETKKLKGLCPVCGKALTIGVEYRVEEIAENPLGYVPENGKPFYKVLPLMELISLKTGAALASKKNWEIYNEILGKFGNEFNVLLRLTREEMQEKNIDEKLIELILLNREGRIKVKPGYDGEYGIAMLANKETTIGEEENKVKSENSVQKKLF